MSQSFMKEKPVFPLLLSMSLPMILSMMVSSLYNIVDSYFVAKISEDAMTALSLVFPIQNLINAVTIGSAIGMNAVISFCLGAQNEEDANRAASQGVFLNTIHGIFLTIVCIGIMPTFLRMFTQDETVIDLGIRYSRIAFAFSIVIAWGMSAEKIFQAIGKMKIAMFSVLFGCITNIVLDPIMIFGVGFFPKMGIEGAALATGIGQTLNLFVYIIVSMREKLSVKISLKYVTLDKNLCKKLYAIGIPAMLNLALPSLLISSLNTILAAYSQAYVVVLGVYYKLQTFLYLPANGIIQGMRPIIGYNYGANEMHRVKKIYRVAIAMAAGIMAVGTVVCMVIPEILIGLFTTSPETIVIGENALRIISLGFVVSSISIISCGALEGLGKGVPSLIISVLRYVVIIIPTAFILSQIFGAEGVWYAFGAAELLTAMISYIVYKKSVRESEY